MKPLFRPALFNPRVLAKRIATTPTPVAHKQILHDWAATIRNGSISKKSNKEAAIRSAFIHKFFVEILGYVPFGSGATQSISEEHQTGVGRADAALGFFSAAENRIIAPVELKGADTPNLDAIMPGRHKSPVQQAWEYAADTPGRKFIVLSNMLEIRLYAYAHTRQIYESFDILELADSDSEYQRFCLLLGANNLLNGHTEKLLSESADAEKSITRKLYSDYRDWRIQLIVALAQHNAFPLPDLIAHAQTILDRILFIAFAEDRDLLPQKTIESAYQQSNPYAPQAVWENFTGLFRAVDKGNSVLGIPAYNGGLFKPSAAMDALIVPDKSCEIFKEIAAYDFASEVSVTVLGHIFEQSVSDLEELRELTDLDAFVLKANALRAVSSGVSGKRKEHGIVYTPDDITAFIVEQTLGGYLTDRREKLRSNYLNSPAKKKAADDVIESSYRSASDLEKKQSGKVRDAKRLTEFLFWNAWRDELQHIKIVDPACGSGAFLIAAFDVLDAEYRQVNEQLQAITGTRDLFDINREILNGNLYGVDLNPESIEISKLSLWLKTAQHGKPLQSLEANLRVGNSLIAEMNGGADFSVRAFDWQGAFAEVFAAGGFDVVLGNPPYVRMELLKPIKPYLETHYQVASDRADLYCYFFELGVNLLKVGGRLGYISSSTFFKNGSGEPLRRLLLEKTTLKSIVDFSDVQIFEGVATLPAIVVLENNLPKVDSTLRALKLLKTPEGGLPIAFLQTSKPLSQSSLKLGVWRIEDDAQSLLREKLICQNKTIKQVYGSPCRGIVTGLNEAFVIDRATRDSLIAEDVNSSELLKPTLEGKDVKNWHLEPQDLWLIYIPKGEIDITNYPAIEAHLLPFKNQLERRATKQAWFELQQPQAAYREDFSGKKIIYPEFSRQSAYLDERGYFINNKIFYLKGGFFELGLFNSNAMWFLIKGLAPIVIGGSRELRAQYIETLPIPTANETQRAEIAQLAEACQRAAEARRDCQAAFRHRITDLAALGAVKLNTKLNNWWLLDFAAFRAEVKKQFKQDIPLAERNDWEAYFNQQRDLVQNATQQITQHEAALNRLVYALFSLSKDEITLIESAV